MLRLSKSLGKKCFLRTKLVYLRLNFSWKSKALNLRQPKLSASYKESVTAIFQSVNVPFLTSKSLSIVDTPTPCLIKGEGLRGRVRVFKIFEKKKRGSDFSSHKNGGVQKIGGVVLKKVGVSPLFVLTNLHSVIFLWVFGVCVCVCVCFDMNWFKETGVSFLSNLWRHSGLWNMVLLFHKANLFNW